MGCPERAGISADIWRRAQLLWLAEVRVHGAHLKAWPINFDIERMHLSGPALGGRCIERQRVVPLGIADARMQVGYKIKA
jgi:hypothetical protein